MYNQTILEICSCIRPKSEQYSGSEKKEPEMKHTRRQGEWTNKEATAKKTMEFRLDDSITRKNVLWEWREWNSTKNIKANDISNISDEQKKIQSIFYCFTLYRTTKAGTLHEMYFQFSFMNHDRWVFFVCGAFFIFVAIHWLSDQISLLLWSSIALA